MCLIALDKRDILSKVESMKAIWRILPSIERLNWIWPMRDSLRRYCWELQELALQDCIEFEVDTRALETLVHRWRRDQNAFRDVWQTLSWDSGPHDPVVVYDRISHRPIRGEVRVVEGTSEVVNRFCSFFSSSGLMPPSMSRKEWRTYLAG